MSNQSSTNHIDAATVKLAMERWQQVPFSNRFMFRLVMENPELCKRTLEVILGIRIRKLLYHESEKSIEAQLFSKGVRLDIYIEDEDGVAYDLEMQSSDADGLALGKRTRYYQSLLDINQLKKGQHYTDLKKSIIIFVCCYDPFKLNLMRYTFSNTCQEKKTLELGDESSKLFINTKGNIGNESQELLSFINFVNTGKGNDDFTEQLEAAVRLNHMDTDKAVTYMTIEQEMQTIAIVAANKARAEGMAEGRVEGKAEGMELFEKLFSKLMNEGRIEDMKKVLQDAAYRDRLLKEELGV